MGFHRISHIEVDSRHKIRGGHFPMLDALQVVFPFGGQHWGFDGIGQNLKVVF